MFGRFFFIFSLCCFFAIQLICTIRSDSDLHSLVALEPAVSPDGTEVIFSMYGSIWTVPADGGEAKELFHLPGVQSRPKWSPDGSGIAYLRELDGIISAHVFTKENNEHLQVRDRINGSPSMCWHTDNQSLFITDNEAVYLCSPGVEKFIANVEPTVMDMCVSPNGRYLVYSSFVRIDRQEMRGRLYCVDVRSGERAMIDERVETLYQLQWAPDGRQIAAGILDKGNHDLILIPVEKGIPEKISSMIRITSHERDDYYPTWTPDQRELVFLSNRSGLPHIYKIDIDSHRETQIPITRYNWSAANGSITLSLSDKRTGSPLSARVYVTAEDEKPYFPPDTYIRKNQSRGKYFYHQNGTAQFTLPTGTYSITAAAGFEYQPETVSIDIQGGGEHEVDIELSRLTDMNSQGWYSGETHIHANYSHNGPYWLRPDDVMRLIEAEHLNVGNVLPANRFDSAILDGEHFTGKSLEHAAKPYVLFYGAEFRGTSFGHLCLLGIQEWFDPMFSGLRLSENPFDYPSNGDIADSTHTRGGVVTYAHPILRQPDPFQHDYEALGVVMDLPRSRIDAFDIKSYGGTGNNSMHFFHRLLNCGFRLTASTGTDVFLNRIYNQTPGGDRMYVKVEGPFSYASWLEGLRRGRTFVTNNPILQMRVNDQLPGSVIRLKSADEPLRISLKGLSTAPMREVQVFYNGRIIKRRQLEKDSLKFDLEFDFSVSKSGWVAACVLGERHYLVMGTHLFGYAGPVYIEYQNKPVTSPEDARYLLNWLNRFQALLESRNRWKTPVQKEHIMRQINQARAFYLKQIES